MSLYLLLGTQAPSDYAIAICGAVGVTLIAIATSGSDRLVNLIQGLVTGWP